jgi:hypothetical protein
LRKTISFVVLLVASRAWADDVLHPGTAEVDPPTLVSLGVAWPITGDDNFNATVTMRYRVAGMAAWRDALPLQHVHAELVAGATVQPSFAGSIFDLQPATSYEIELHATDPDGAVDSTVTLSAITRAVPPAMPASPRAVPVSTAAELTAALDAAQAGDVIELAAGMYTGNFGIHASGTASDPIVIRGVDQSSVILDGGGCTGCNVLETYGSFIHVEDLTIQHASRALRFQSAATHDNVVRRVRIRDVILGIGSSPDQRDFYIADNILEGRLVWPCVYSSTDPACNAGGEAGLHANDDGINVQGDGHVIAHNRVTGFGDAIKTEPDGVRSIDIYGNDVLSAYDNGIELDGSLRNTRALRNRFTNTYATMSFQPIFGGPAYVIRNVLYNVADEQFKLHARTPDPTVGAVIYHTTVIRSLRAIQCSSSDTPYAFTVENNLFVGPAAISDGYTVRYDVPSISTATSDYNGYFPDGQFEFGYSAGAGGVHYTDLAGAAAGGLFEVHGTVVDATTFAAGTTAPGDFMTAQVPIVPELGASSAALDRGVVLPNIDDGYQGAAPDLGALERGCEPPIYGPRPLGVDESKQLLGCAPETGDSDSVGGDDPPTDQPGSGSGCCDASGNAPGSAALFLLVALITLRPSSRATHGPTKRRATSATKIGE